MRSFLLFSRKGYLSPFSDVEKNIIDHQKWKDPQGQIKSALEELKSAEPYDQ
jgi:hypothetical protein